ncbi:MAG: hypothetical protein JJT88_03540 [Gammaproteobacteria bacterium]|nr:hypothetical protein [Gammaproteobacteria bacterium]
MSELLTERRREALRLDLEDQQKVLIEEVYRLSQGLIHGSGAPESFAAGLLAGESPNIPDGVKAAERLDEELRRLRDISRALTRLSRPDFGCCEQCGEVIPFSDLASDATRRSCSGRCGRV